MNLSGKKNPMKNFTLRYAVPLWKWYVAGFFALAATNLITLEIPQLAKHIVNAIETSTRTESLDAGLGEMSLPHIAILIISLGILQVFVRSMSRIFVFWPGRTIEAQCRNDVFDHLLALPQVALEKFGMGDLISRLANDIGQLRVFYAFGLLQILNLIFLCTFIVTRMMSVHVGLTLACVLPLSLMLIITKYAMPKMQHYSKLNQEATGRLTNKVTEAFVNVHVVQQSGAEQTFLNRTKDENRAVYDSNMKLVVLRNAVFPLMSALASVGQMMVIFYGGFEVIHNRLTVGDILAFNVYIGFLSFPLTAFGMIIAMYQRARTAILRLQEIDQQPIESGDSSDTMLKSLPNWQQSNNESEKTPILSVKNLSFTYCDHLDSESSDHSNTDDEKLTNRSFKLSEISFELFPGERLGISGPVGSGKTTLLQLLVRLQAPPPGTVYLHGKDVTTIAPSTVRQHLAMATQSVHLFSASVEDNLKFGVPKVTDQEIRKATSDALILDEILNLPDGFDTNVGEKGIRLSGGQKQRLALARLFLRRPDIMLLDDVFSAVDQLTETRLIRNLIQQGCGIIVSSHRPSVLKCCDKILILESGAIKTAGSWSDVAPHLEREP